MEDLKNEKIKYKKLKLKLIITIIFIFLISCKPTIKKECLTFFESLENQKFWSKTPFELVLIDEYGNKQNIYENAPLNTEIWIQFLTIEYKEVNRKNEPIKANINISYYNGSKISYLYISINEENRKVLEDVISNMETDEIMKEGLINEKI